MELTKEERDKLVLNNAREICKVKGVDVSYENMAEVLHCASTVPTLLLLSGSEFVGMPGFGKLTVKTKDLETNAKRELQEDLIDKLLTIDLKHLPLLKVLNLNDNVKLERVHHREHLLLRRSKVAKQEGVK